MKKMLKKKINLALTNLNLAPPTPDRNNFTVEEPRDREHGHLATNAALVLAKSLGRKPRELAELIIKNLTDPEGYIEKAEVAGPGFINFTLSLKWWAWALADLLRTGPAYGRAAARGQKIMLEFVSANPTGPLHVGHGRGAAIGDALARILNWVGYEVSREYYINDTGRQMRILGESVLARLQELQGSTEPFPEDHYRGTYIMELAQKVLAEKGPEILDLPKDEAVTYLADFAGDQILVSIKNDLATFKVEYQTWFSEKSLHREGQVEKVLSFLKEKNHLYEQDDALWFNTEPFGDDKNRVLVKSSGERTYFATDIAYHWNKFQRGFSELVNVLGADHHGYVPRLKAATTALGNNPSSITVLLVQFVNLVRDGQPVAMSTRTGEFITLKEVLNEVGVDAARFIFLTRSPDTPLEFDLNLARTQTRDNPVYYVQYVGARIESILKNAPPAPVETNLLLLAQPEESNLIKHLTNFPELIEIAATRREPHLLATYLTVLARLFHHYYSQHHVIVPNLALAAARLELIRAVRLVVHLGLNLLGVSSPDQM
ncbi:MAG: hypothetical protein AMR96_03545 [Candidatus Adiutrix intracellularis]|jgi:arginyl-tRNA synthetase|nr:MAG: hypothetical protein AMR96_03545 [Candidatus Adiutrix intracellularis]MDR2827254.1 arginine--tRNA ligase [Candidatus Adiutrix intracellularis]